MSESVNDRPIPFDLLALNASPSATSKTHVLAQTAVEIAGRGKVVNLVDLDSDGLLGRKKTPDVLAALNEIRESRLLLIATPIYRATYTGLLKVLFDQFEQNALANTVSILSATGGSHHHFLSLDTGLRPLVSSLGSVSAATVVYAIGEDFDESGQVTENLRGRLQTAITEAALLANAKAS